jgi:two-component system chemotaxis sensor kinase CheA
MDQVVETDKVAQRDIIRIKNKETVVLRDRIIPLIRMRQVLGQPAQEGTPDTELSVLVVRRYGQLVGLVIDDFLGKSEVILKPLEGPLSNLKQYSGSALLGDGSVLLIFNLAELLR